MSQNGPCFTKSTYDRKRTKFVAPSPEREKALLEESAREAAKYKELATDPAAWARKHILKLKD